MRIIKKILCLAVCLVLVLSLASCGSKAPETVPDSGQSAPSPEVSTPETQKTDNDSQEGGKTLVIVFSATGNTMAVAQKIADYTGADLYEIVPKELYSDDDLNWRDKNSRSSKEHSDPDFRPEIASEKVSLSGYSTVFIGYPIWWGEEPRIMDAFVEQYDFTGLTMIPFCTSSTSGIGHSGLNLEEKAGSGTWLEGARFGERATEEEVRKWLDSLS